MDDVLSHDYFGNDPELVRDPYPWFEAARESRRGERWGHRRQQVDQATDPDCGSDLMRGVEDQQQRAMVEPGHRVADARR